MQLIGTGRTSRIFLNGIQRALSIRPSNFLINLENELHQKLEMVLSQEEELWVLKISSELDDSRGSKYSLLSCLNAGPKE